MVNAFIWILFCQMSKISVQKLCVTDNTSFKCSFIRREEWRLIQISAIRYDIMIPTFLMSTITSMPITKANAIKYDMYNDRHKLFFLTILPIYYSIIKIFKRCFITFTEHDWCMLFCPIVMSHWTKEGGKSLVSISVHLTIGRTILFSNLPAANMKSNKPENGDIVDCFQVTVI